MKKLKMGHKSWKVETRGKKDLRSVKTCQNRPIGGWNEQKKLKKVLWMGLENFKMLCKRVKNKSKSLTRSKKDWKIFKKEK